MNRSHIVGGLLLIAVIICATAFSYWYVSVPRDKSNSDASTALSNATVGTYVNLAGEAISLDEYKGTVRVVTSWASWNPFSVNDLGVLNTIAATYPDSEVVFIAVNRKETKEQAERFLKSLPEFGDIEFVIDTQDLFYSSIGGYAMPETVIYDNRGNIVIHKRGTFTETELKDAIESVRAKAE